MHNYTFPLCAPPTSYDSSIASECDEHQATGTSTDTAYQESLPHEVSSLLPCYTSSPLPCVSEGDSSLSSQSFSPRALSVSLSEVTDNRWFGFKVVGDNIDKTVKPRHETMKHHN